ncbi:hypothetical protein V3C99_007772 [Haemonchus contortus]
MAQSCLNENLLFICIGTSVVLGITLGLALRTFELSSDSVSLLQFPGEIFMRLLKLMILPLVVASLISSLAQMDAANSSLMGVVTLIYYLTTVFLATLLGIFLVLTIHPGDPRLAYGLPVVEAHKISALDSILDLIRNMFPDNIVQASFERSRTVHRTNVVARNNVTVQEITKEVSDQRGMNIIGIIVFCIGFGVVSSFYAEKVRVVVDFFVALDKIVMELMLSVMWFSPFGITSLICGSLLELDDIWIAAGAMSKYVLTILVGLLIHSFITIPALYVVITRKNPIKIFRCMRQAGAVAMGTASSGAALPLSISGMEEEGGIDERVTRFVLPFGANVNMDGCALYEAVAVIFIAQINQVQLRADQIITISITSTIASLGLNAVPAGLVSILLILSTVGLPTTEVPLLFAVDWLLDRIRTALNVIGDGFAASVVEYSLKKHMKDCSPLPTSDIVA